jgi:dihydroflavonol-4-reductase
MRIGITGSAGFLGANLVKALYQHRSAREEILCFYSRRRNNPLTDHLDLSFQHLDITSRQEVVEKTRGLDLLFHLAGIVDYSRKNARRTWDANVLGTKNIFDGALQNRIGKLVYASSINVLGSTGRESAPGNENSLMYAAADNPISFTDRESTLAAVEASIHGDYGFLRRSRVVYFDSKLAGYELALKYYREFGLPVTLVLPGTAVGPGDVGISITKLVMRTFEGRLKFTLPGGSSFVSADDAAEGIRLASAEGQAGQIYIITGRREDNLSYRDFMKLVTEVARARYDRRVFDRFITVPPPLCPLLAAIFRLMPAEGSLSEALILSGAVTHRFDGSKAADRLGYRPQTSLENAIQSCIDFYLQRTQGDTWMGESSTPGSTNDTPI